MKSNTTKNRRLPFVRLKIVDDNESTNANNDGAYVYGRKDKPEKTINNDLTGTTPSWKYYNNQQRIKSAGNHKFLVQ